MVFSLSGTFSSGVLGKNLKSSKNTWQIVLLYATFHRPAMPSQYVLTDIADILFVKAQEYQLDLHPYDFYKFIHTFYIRSLWNTAYYFQDHNDKASYFTAMLKWLNKLKPLVQNWNAR